MNFPDAGILIRDARQRAGLTQADLAKVLRMSRATISQLETGVIVELGARKLGQICEQLGLEVIVRPRLPQLTLNEAYERNRKEREAAFKETDAVLAKLGGSKP